MDNIVVMGIGNLLYGDEGFGVHLVARLAQDWNFPPQVQLVDGGTQGHSLLTFVEEADKMLVLDAVDFGLAPGTISVRKDGDIPAYLSAHKLSPHQNSFSELLALAQLRGTLPQEIVLIGVHPVSLTMGAPLTPAVAAHVPAVLQLALEQLQDWGVDASQQLHASSLYHRELAHLGSPPQPTHCGNGAASVNTVRPEPPCAIRDSL